MRRGQTSRPETARGRGTNTADTSRLSKLPNVELTLLVGGYAQLSYGFNYYGPTSSQREVGLPLASNARAEPTEIAPVHFSLPSRSSVT